MRKFLLSECFRENVQKDAEFEALGILDSRVKLPFLTFIENESYIDKLFHNPHISAVITNVAIYEKYLKDIDCGCYICTNPRLSFFKLHNSLSLQSEYQRLKFETKIGNDCEVSPLAHINKNNVIIGNHVIIEEFVSIKENVIIGDHSIIRAGAVIGGTGFEFKKDKDSLFHVDHCGGVIIGKHVEIQYNSCVDKAIYPWDNTEIGDYSKLDNLIHIGHAVKIRERVMIPAMAAVGGRVEIGDDSWIGLASVIRNGLHIGSNARANMGAVVTKDIADNQAVSGNFAIEHKQFIERLKKGE